MHLFVHAISHYQAMKYRSCQIELSPEPFIVEIYLLSMYCQVVISSCQANHRNHNAMPTQYINTHFTIQSTEHKGLGLVIALKLHESDDTE